MLETARLLYVTTPPAVMRERLLRSDFVAEIPVDGVLDDAPDRRVSVHFSGEWPGPDALAMFPRWVARLATADPPGPWGDGILVHRSDGLAVGSMGFRAAPDAAGTVEIGYAVNRSLRGRGYATEMATALAAWALAQPGVRVVTAECLAGNAASIRVLDKVGFTQNGRRTADDGVLLRWELIGGGVLSRSRLAGATGEGD
jgi:RimJ/RimL family protein N-acetyltransferase